MDQHGNADMYAYTILAYNMIMQQLSSCDITVIDSMYNVFLPNVRLDSVL